MTTTVQYWRADTMWAARGRPDGDLGMESVEVDAGETRTFITDWKHEKQRNDGSTFYGSHARRVRNAGEEPVVVRVKGTLVDELLRLMVAVTSGTDLFDLTLPPGAETKLQHDIVHIRSAAAAPAASDASGPQSASPAPSSGPLPPTTGSGQPAAAEEPPKAAKPAKEPKAPKPPKDPKASKESKASKASKPRSAPKATKAPAASKGAKKGKKDE